MNVIQTSQMAKAMFLWEVVDFCLANQGMAMPWVKDRQQLFRYVASCEATGKLNVVVEDGIKAVAFMWADFKERIEANAAYNKPQFEWGQSHKGDSLFIADVLGERKYVAQGFNLLIAKFPHLVTVPFYTYRSGKLVQLSMRKLERFVFGGKVK